MRIYRFSIRRVWGFKTAELKYLYWCVLFDSEFSCPQVFRLCDQEQKGYLNREDLKMAVVMLFGYKPSKVVRLALCL